MRACWPVRSSGCATLVLHDTTELDYTRPRSIEDLGWISGTLNRGYLCHNSVTYDPRQREMLGLANQILHCRQCQRKAKDARKKREGVKQKRQRLDCESRLWVRGAEAVGAALTGRLWVQVADRGSDNFEFLAHVEQRQQRGFVVRSCSKRVIRHGHDETAAKGDLKVYPHSLPRGADRK